MFFHLIFWDWVLIIDFNHLRLVHGFARFNIVKPVVKLADPLANGVPLKGSPEELKIAQLNPAGESPGSTQRPAEKELIVDGLESVNESETASTPVMECGFSVPLIGPLSYRTV